MPNTLVLMCTKGDEGDATATAYPRLTKNYRHEVEPVVAIGTRGKNIAAADEAKHVYGYAIGLEMTRHDLQGEAKNRPPVGIGKVIDTSAPMGPVTPMATSGEINSGAITLTVNNSGQQLLAESP